MDRNTKANKHMLIAYEKGYRVLKDGRVQGLTRILNLGIKNRNGVFYYNFPVVDYENKTWRVDVHKLMAYQKYGEAIFEDGIETRHLNGNSLDNSESNISIGTHQQNELDKDPGLRMKNAINASENIRRFTDVEMHQIKCFHKEHRSYKKTMEKFKIGSKGTLHHILNNKYVTHK